MHDRYMATKTISLELDAYEKLSRAKRSPRESFSQVVRRAVWPEEGLTGARLLARVRAQMRAGTTPIDEATLDRLDAAQASPRRASSKW